MPVPVRLADASSVAVAVGVPVCVVVELADFEAVAGPVIVAVAEGV